MTGSGEEQEIRRQTAPKKRKKSVRSGMGRCRNSFRIDHYGMLHAIFQNPTDDVISGTPRNMRFLVQLLNKRTFNPDRESTETIVTSEIHVFGFDFRFHEITPLRSRIPTGSMTNPCLFPGLNPSFSYILANSIN